MVDRLRRSRFVVLLLILLAAAVPVQAATSSEALLDESVAQVKQGQFAEALASLDANLGILATNPQLNQLHTWLQDFAAMQAQRNTMRQADYDRYMELMQKRIDQEKWAKAVEHLYKAYLSAADADAFRADPHVREVVDKVVAQAAKLRKEDKWIDAIRIYAPLSEIFDPYNEEYQRLREECRVHILLEESFDKEGKWRDLYTDIEPDMARRALRLIHDNYVSTPDFQTITADGLNRLLMVAATKKLAETFPSMKDSFLLEAFQRQIGKRLEQVKQEPRLTLSRAIDMFDHALRINHETLDLPEEMVIAEYMDGAMSSLDQFSSIIWPADVQEFRKDTMGEFSGIGVQIMMEKKVLKITSPLEDTPAYEAGLQAGDIISTVNGESTTGMTINEAVRKITGPAGTLVVLGITRAGEEKELEIPVVRQRIVVHSVKGIKRNPDGGWNDWADPERKIAYIRVTGFMDKTAEELFQHLSELHEQEVRGLILDLRFNPGGLLKSAVDLCSFFLKPGAQIVSTRGRNSDPWSQSVEFKDGFTNVPIVVLVNDVSASASEIVSGALQDQHRAIVLGSRTFGKGLVQNLQPLTTPATIADPVRGYLKLTTAKYYLPNGRCIQKEPGNPIWGVDPDIMLPLVPKEMVKVRDLHRKRDVLKGKNQTELPSFDEPEDEDVDEGTEAPTTNEAADADAEEEKDKNEYPEIDPQLDAALLLMRARLMTNKPWEFKTPTTIAAGSPPSSETQ